MVTLLRDETRGMIIGGPVGIVAVVLFLVALFLFWSGNVPAGFVALVVGAGAGELVRRRAKATQESQGGDVDDDSAPIVRRREKR